MTASTSATKRPPSKAQVQDAVSVGIARAVQKAGGKGTLAEKLETSVDTIGRGMSGDNIPGLHVLLGSLTVEPTALNEAMALVGMTVTPLRSEPANDMALMASLSGASAEVAKRLLDRILCHNDKAVLASIFRPLIAEMQAVVDEHDARVRA